MREPGSPGSLLFFKRGPARSRAGSFSGARPDVRRRSKTGNGKRKSSLVLKGVNSSCFALPRDDIIDSREMTKTSFSPDLAGPASVLEIVMKFYSFVKRPGQFSFNTQESIVFRALQSLKSGTLEDLAAKAVELGLKTRQDPERIVAYYMVSLKKLGLAQASGTTNRKVTIVIDDEDESEVEQLEDQTSDAPDA